MKKLLILLGFSILTLAGACSKKSNDGDTPTKVDKKANLLNAGDSAHDILSNEKFDKLVIEVDYVTGFGPTDQAVAQFTAFLKRHTFKDNIEVIYDALESPKKDSLSLQDIADLEQEHRSSYNSGNTLAIYIYFADAPAADDSTEEGLVTLGAVYRNTSMVIHEVTVRQLASQSLLISNADVEAATMNHEFGHLFGLVNLGTAMVVDHEDPNAENHCSTAGCLMRAELQFSSSVTGKSASIPSHDLYKSGFNTGCVLNGKTVLSLLHSNTAKASVAVPGIGNDCLADIQANGGE